MVGTDASSSVECDGSRRGRRRRVVGRGRRSVVVDVVVPWSRCRRVRCGRRPLDDESRRSVERAGRRAAPRERVVIAVEVEAVIERVDRVVVRVVRVERVDGEVVLAHRQLVVVRPRLDVLVLEPRRELVAIDLVGLVLVLIVCRRQLGPREVGCAQRRCRRHGLSGPRDQDGAGEHRGCRDRGVLAIDTRCPRLRRLRFADGNELDLGRVGAPALAKVKTIKLRPSDGSTTRERQARLWRSRTSPVIHDGHDGARD